MTTFVESVTVEVRCSAWVGQFFPETQCNEAGRATIVATKERGDIVLVPVGWDTDIKFGRLEVYCPAHKEKKETQ